MPAIAHQNKILGNTSGGGSTILVTTSESTLYGQTVTLSDGTTTLTGTFSNAGECEFTGVMMVGTLTATSGTASTSINVPYFGVYSIILSLFSATITATYSGGTCTCVGNGESYTASSSPYTFTVHGAATYTITNTIDGVSKTDTVTITTDGQSESVTISFGTINVTYDNAFRGTSITCVQSGTTITKTAPSGANTMTFYPPTTGNWVISGTVSSDTYYSSPNPVVVSSLSTAETATLQTNASVTVTIYSATEDTLSYTDAEGAKTAVFASGESSKSITLVIPASGMNITFTSSRAKEPTDLTSYYSKTVAVTTSTTEIYVMPDNCIYWYGWKLDATNNWTGITHQSLSRKNYTSNTNSLYVQCNTSQFSSWGTSNKITFSKVHAIGSGSAFDTGTGQLAMIGFASSTTPDIYAGTGFTTSSFTQTHCLTPSGTKHLTINESGTYYLVWVPTRVTSTLDALWYEV